MSMPLPLLPGRGTFFLFARPFLDTATQSYENLLTLSAWPAGPLQTAVCRVRFPPPSPFAADRAAAASCRRRAFAGSSSSTCGLALRASMLLLLTDAADAATTQPLPSSSAPLALPPRGPSYVASNNNNACDLLCAGDTADLLAWLLEHDYDVRTDLSRLCLENPLQLMPAEGSQIIAAVSYRPPPLLLPTAR